MSALQLHAVKKTRQEAIEAGETRYNTGEPCLRGHVSDRRTVSGACIECQKEERRYAAEKIREGREAREGGG